MYPQTLCDYGVRVLLDNTSNTLTAIVNFTFERFAMLDVNEIPLAFEMAAAGKLQGCDGVRFYGGEPSVEAVGEVLRSYLRFRVRFFQPLVDAAERAVKREKENADNEKKRAEFEVYFPKMVREARDKFSSWEQVPFFWFDSCKKRGWIPEMSDEVRREIWDRALKIANVRIQRQSEQNSLLFKHQRKPLDDVAMTRKGIACRIVIYEQVINNNHSKLWSND